MIKKDSDPEIIGQADWHHLFGLIKLLMVVGAFLFFSIKGASWFFNITPVESANEFLNRLPDF